MSLVTLAKNDFFSAGATLWAAPQASEFELYDQLDWYLNLLLSKAQNHRLQEPSLEILDILKKTSQSFNRTTLTEKAPQIFTVPRLVPTKFFLQIHYTKDHLKEWLGEIEKTATRLQVRHLRIFLPTSVTTLPKESDFQFNAFDEITVAPNLGMQIA